MRLRRARDQVYQGQGAVLAQRAPKANDLTGRRRRTKVHVFPEIREANRMENKTRSRVEHTFAVLKLRFGFADPAIAAWPKTPTDSRSRPWRRRVPEIGP